MYYMGGNFERTNVVSYLPKGGDDRGGPVPEDAELRGMKMRIGAAISQDGITWGRIEGDDPSGACMVPYDRGDINNADVGIARDEETGRPYHVDEELYCVSFFSFVLSAFSVVVMPPPACVCVRACVACVCLFDCLIVWARVLHFRVRYSHADVRAEMISHVFRDDTADVFLFFTLSLSLPLPLLSRDGRR